MVESSGKPPDKDKRAELQEGVKIGSYRVLRLLGYGGMGKVYEVEHIDLKKRYALKIMSYDCANDTRFRKRFELEARVMATLVHPNIVSVQDFGNTDGMLWFRMELMQGVKASEYVEGAQGQAISLSDLMNNGAGGGLPEKVVARVLKQVLSGMAYAHSLMVVHRDLKPGNILLAEGAGGLVAKVTDFGLVKVVGEEWRRSMAPILSTGSSTRDLVGTRDYMSPEQKRGLTADSRSDVYAMGLITNEMLTGERAGSFSYPSDVGCSKSWDGLVKQARETAPSNRFKDAGDMLTALEKFVHEVEGAEKIKTGNQVRHGAARKHLGIVDAGVQDGTDKQVTARPNDLPRSWRDGLRTISGWMIEHPVFTLATLLLLVTYLLAAWLSGSPTRKDVDTYFYEERAKSTARIRVQAEQGDATSQLRLGKCYLEGLGVEENMQEAVRWFRKAAEQGLAEAQGILGACYKEGKGVSKDDAIAVDWYRKSATQGNVYAQYELGVCYASGEGVQKDEEEATKWFERAAQQKHSGAQEWLDEHFARALLHK